MDLVCTGVGKANAAGAVATTFDQSRHSAVINIGVAGSLPAAQPPALGDVVLASVSMYADEGAIEPAGFRTLADLGFPPAPENDREKDGMGVRATPWLATALQPLAHCTGVIATVSTCSGADAAAREVVARTGALAEAMEGAAVGMTLRRLIQADLALTSLAFAELRVISNTTGDRTRQTWNLRAALDTLARLAARVRELVLAVDPAD